MSHNVKHVEAAAGTSNTLRSALSVPMLVEKSTTEALSNYASSAVVEASLCRRSIAAQSVMHTRSS